MNALLLIPLVLQLYGPARDSQYFYTVGQTWNTPIGAYTSTTKTIWAPNQQAVWARFVYVWSPGSCVAKVRLIARDASGSGLPEMVLGQINACDQSNPLVYSSATTDRINKPDNSAVDITQNFNQALHYYPNGYFYVLYQVQDDGITPHTVWESRLELWMTQEVR